MLDATTTCMEGVTPVGLELDQAFDGPAHGCYDEAMKALSLAHVLVSVALASALARGRARSRRAGRRGPRSPWTSRTPTSWTSSACSPRSAGSRSWSIPGVSCKLTLKLNEVRWTSALDVALKSCGLGQDEENEHRPRGARGQARGGARRAAEARRGAAASAGPLQMRIYRLSYARAAEMAPIVKKFLSPRGEVIYDSRTNTLIVMDVR